MLEEKQNFLRALAFIELGFSLIDYYSLPVSDIEKFIRFKTEKDIEIKNKMDLGSK